MSIQVNRNASYYKYSTISKSNSQVKKSDSLTRKTGFDNGSSESSISDVTSSSSLSDSTCGNASYDAYYNYAGSSIFTSAAATTIGVVVGI